jgi:TRAP-type mannitol/chloroaromatic compound transport system permease small subunit
MERVIRISDRLRALVEGVGRFAKWLIVPMILVTLFDVVSRKFVGLQSATATVFGDLLNSTRLQELEWHLHTALFALCLGFGYLRNAHVRVDLVSSGRSPRWRAWVEFLGCVLFLLPYCLVVIWFGIDFALRSYLQGEVSASMMGLPQRWLIKSVFVVGMVLALLAGLSVMLRYLVVLFGPPGAADPPFEAARLPNPPPAEL